MLGDDLFNTGVTDVLKGENEVVMEDYYGLADKIYSDFDEQAHKKGHGYSCSAFPIFDKRLEGLEEGLYIFAGESNGGKTAFMTNLAWNYAQDSRNKLFVVYYSLDDNTGEIIPRLLAMTQRIPIAVGSKPTRYEDYIAQNKDSEDPEIADTCDRYMTYLDKREQGLQMLRDANKQFLILDRSTVKNLEQILDHAKKVQMYVKSFDEENNILICIDSLADVTVDKKFSSDKERIDYVSMRIKEAANCELKIPIFTSYHLRKLNHQGRPTLDDVKDSSRIIYESSVCFLIHNDVSKNKQAAAIYYTSPESSEKLPIVEIAYEKNKKSSFKGRLYYYFVPDYSYVRETSYDEMRRYDGLVYTK